MAFLAIDLVTPTNPPTLQEIVWDDVMRPDSTTTGGELAGLLDVHR